VSRVAADSMGSRFPPAMLANMPKSPLAVDISDILLECPGWTEERLHDTPDDQLLFFWTESAFFNLSDVVEEGKLGYSESDTSQRKKYYQEIRDRDRIVVGRTSACHEENQKLNKERAEFILLASNNLPFYARQKVVLQIERRAGVAYRVNIAEIEEGAWLAAMPSRTLVALG